MTSARCRGAALLLALAMLAVLSILAVAFIKQTGQEASAATNYRLKLRARMASEAGLEAARGRLLAHYATAVVDGPDAAACPWVYGESPQLPLGEAGAVSFKQGELSLRRQPAPVGYSGLLPTALAEGLAVGHGVHYALRTEDNNARLNLNDPNPNLPAMLDALGEGIARYDGVGDPIRGRGGLIVAARDALPLGRFSHWRELSALPFLSGTEVEILRPYLAVHGWRDRSVIRPKAQPTPPSEIDPAGLVDYAALRRLFRKRTGPSELRFELELARASDGTLGRAPVNLNTAPLPVLYACVHGLAARGFLYVDGLTYRARGADVHDSQLGGFGYVEPPRPTLDLPPYDWRRARTDPAYRAWYRAERDRLYAIYWPALRRWQAEVDRRKAEARRRTRTFRSGSRFWAWAELPAIDAGSADAIVRALDERRRLRPFHSFHDLATALPARHRAVVLINANPNARLLKLNPDRSLISFGRGEDRGEGEVAALDHAIDKSDLTYWTTEFVFCSHGSFRIESLGRVVGAQERVLASSRVAETIELFRVLKHTSQRDFEVGLDEREQSLTLPESMADQEGRLDRASEVDGQVALAPDGSARGASWVIGAGRTALGGRTAAFPGNRLLSRFADAAAMPGWRYKDIGWTSWRDPGDHVPWLTRERLPTIREHAPVDRLQPAGERDLTVLGAHRGLSERTSRLGSQLLPDGVHHDPRTRGPRQLSYHMGGRRSALHPQRGAIEVWFKPEGIGAVPLDTRAMRGSPAPPALTTGDVRPYPLLADLTWVGPGVRPGQDHGMPMLQRNAHFMTAEERATARSWPRGQLHTIKLYGYDGYLRLQAAGGMFHVGGRVSPLTKLSGDLTPPEQGNYFLDTQWMGARFPRRVQEWCHLRIVWDDWIHFRVELDGVELLKVSGAFQRDSSWIRTLDPVVWGEDQIIDRLNVLDRGSERQIQDWAVMSGYYLGHRIQGHFMAIPYLNGSFWGTIGETRGYYRKLPPASGRPHRLRPTDGTSFHAGRFKTGPGKVHALSARFTAYHGWNGHGRVLASEVRLALDEDADDRPGQTVPALAQSLISPPAVILDRTFDGARGLAYEAIFFDGGQRPLTATPYLDDVTLFYVAGAPRVLQREDLD